MATLALPAIGYGLRYEHGIFKQSIENGWQREQPDNWLLRPDPWEGARPHETVEVKLNCSFEIRGGTFHIVWFALMLPRHLEIIYEINRRLLDSVRTKFPTDGEKVQRISLIEEDGERKVRITNLAIVVSHSTNGVAAIYSRLLRTTTVKSLAEMFPARFSNKTNGVTPRRWLLLSNPSLSQIITEALGDGWITDLSHLRKLKALADEPTSAMRFRKAKRQAKVQFADWLNSSSGIAVDPDTIFNAQIKRIHEYKRQLPNALRIVVIYNRLRENPDPNSAPRTFFFSCKAAPAYQLAKLIIKFIHNVAATIDQDTVVCNRLKVVFLPEYSRSPEPGRRRAYEYAGPGRRKLALAMLGKPVDRFRL